MVGTRSQKNKMAANSQTGNHATKDETRKTTPEFVEKVIEKMDSLESSWKEAFEKLQQRQDEILDQNDELKTRLEFSDLRCTRLEEGLKEVEESRDQGLAEIENLKGAFDKIKQALENAQDEIVVLKRALRHNSGVPHVKVKEPESYDGVRSAKILGNFLWDMEQYLERLNLTKGEAQVKVAAQFLTNDAKMWWRRRADQVANGSAEDITSWDDMKKAMQTHFSPQDETWEARSRIKYIKQTGSLQTYQQEYSSAVLELPDMSEKDKVFNFIIGLKPWARNEVKRQKIRTLEEAFAAVDRLVDHYDETSSEKRKPEKPKEKKREGTSRVESSAKEKRPLKCWICEGPHMAKNCSSKPKVTAVVQEEEEDNTSIGMMQILGASAAAEVTSRRNPERNRLEYVNMEIGGVKVLTMVDSGASHNFMSEDVVRKLGLKFVPVDAHMKTVNSPPTAILGIAEKVETVLGEWSGKVDFTIVRINDYEAVLGMEFMKQHEAMIVPHLRKLYIYDGRSDVPIGVPTVGVTKRDHRLGGMQVERNEEVNKKLASMEVRFADQDLVIKALSDSILDLTRRLEKIEEDDEMDEMYAKRATQEEDHEAYLRRLEMEDPDAWIEWIGRDPPGSSPSTSA